MALNDDEVRALSERVGIATRWHDIFGTEHQVGIPTLRSVLAALGPVETPSTLPPLITADTGKPVFLPAPATSFELTLEDGRRFDGRATPVDGGCTIRAILEPGYHRLTIGSQELTVAVAPPRASTGADLGAGNRAWGIAVQLYSLRRPGDAGIGDYAALADFAREVAATGAQALAISPVHAQFSADPDRFSPYAPSSRVALNVLHCPVDLNADARWQDRAAALEALPLIDWPAAARARLERLCSIFAEQRADPDLMEEFYRFRSERGETIELHARFEALHAHLFGEHHKYWHWRHWPPAFRDHRRPEVAHFAREHARQVEFHAFLQFLADRGLQRAQAAARDSGMAIGLITDLAVGVDSGGSQAWAQPDQILSGLTIGAPPDLFQRTGQNWGLAAFSPQGLRAHGFSAFRAMLDTALAHAGGVRIDHAMGLRRLWVIPEGADATEGTYLAFPEADLLRLLTLESQRRRAVILAEDLGTVPEGFAETLSERGIHGMRVLWFERDQAQAFKPPATWSPVAAAMTSTHDLPTVAGWWSGRDLEWRARLGTLGEQDEAERAAERTRLWQAMQASGAAEGDPPAASAPAQAAEAACVHVAGSACALAILPIEDVLGLEEQPNLPNTIDEHPNWRRRLPADLGAQLRDRDALMRRIAARRVKNG